MADGSGFCHCVSYDHVKGHSMVAWTPASSGARKYHDSESIIVEAT